MELTIAQAAHLRARANRLHGRHESSGVDGVVAAVRDACGIQAQDWTAAGLAVRVRTRDSTAADVEAARVRNRSVVRGWFMRGTLHLVAAEDVGWLLALLGNRFVAGTLRRYRQLGLDQDACDRAATTIERAVRDDGPLSKQELSERLRWGGLATGPKQRVPHLIRYTALLGRVCYGPDRDGHETWVSTEDWLGKGVPHVDPQVAAGELARRYLAAYGPARVVDFATWSGLPVPTARAAIRSLGGALTEVRVAGEPMLVLGRAPNPPRQLGRLRLLGAFDPYLLGYRDRAVAVDGAYARLVHPGGGMFHPTVVRDGRAVGTWRRDGSTVVIEPFDGAVTDIDGEIDRLQRWWRS